jgi:pyrroline-5-carboxylate reductase
MLNNQPIVMFGCGNMGQAILQKMAYNGDIYVVKPTPIVENKVKWVDDVAKLPLLENPIIILAVKPQIMHQIISENQHMLRSAYLICTMAAGLNLAFYHNIIGADAPIIRIMPNTPAKIGQGVINLYANEQATEAQKDIINQMFRMLGKLIWLHEEQLLDLSTAISGSGSAYVYAFIEGLRKAAEHYGMPSVTARQMAEQTVLGAAAMAVQNPEKSLQKLISEVASKGGTTEAALQQLQKNNSFENMIFAAIEAAINRGEQIKIENSIA